MTTPTPAIPTFTDGLPAHANALNALGSNIQNLYNYTVSGFLTGPPICIANQTTGQGIATATASPLSFNTTIVNTGNMWVSSQPTQITIQTAGVYLMTAQAKFPGSNSTGDRELDLCVNGTNVGTNCIARSDAQHTTSNYTVSLNCSQFYRLAAGATIFAVAVQNSGSTLTTDVTSLVNSSLSAMWVSQ